MIISTDHAGRVCTLTYNGQPVKPGEILEDFRGDQYRATGGQAPHKASSTGQIYTDGGNFYPTVFDCKWTPDTEAHDMTPEQQKTIYALRDAGYLVIIWTPQELDGIDPSHIEDALIERGNDMIEAMQTATDDSRSNGPHQ